MDNIIMRWYNQNRKIIWIVILTVVGIIALIQTLNNNYENDKNTISNSVTTYSKDNYSVITREEINETTSEESISLITNFIKYCNNQEIEKAYDLLSTQCKEELYPSLLDKRVK